MELHGGETSLQVLHVITALAVDILFVLTFLNFVDVVGF